MFTLIAKIFKLLNSETDPRQIALAISLALIPALTPIFSIHNLLVLLAIALFRVNMMAFILALIIFKPVGFVLSPLTNMIGYITLTIASMEPLWATMYNNAAMKLTNFNNTHLMGGLVLSLVLFVPLYIISTKLIIKYREKFMTRFNSLQIVQIIKASKIYSIYSSIKGVVN